MAYAQPVHGPHEASFSLPSILAIIAAIVSFFVSGGVGFLLAILAIVLGLIGVLLSLSPNVRGGVTSTVSILIGAIGIVVAILKVVF
jgi:hypothetical protein